MIWVGGHFYPEFRHAMPLLQGLHTTVLATYASGREWDTIKPVRDQPLRQVPQVVFFTVPKQSIGRQPAQRDTATSVSSSQAHRSDKTSRSTGSRAACPVFAAKGRRGRRPHQEDAKTACPNLCKVMLPKADVQLPDKLPYRIADTLQESCPDSPSSSAPTSSTINRSSVQDLHLFAVYDGHAGPHASSHCSERLHHHFCSALSAICPTWVSSGNSQHRDSDPGTPSSRSSSSGSESSFQLSRADTLAWLDDDILDDWPMLAGGSWHPERGRSRLPFRAIRSSSHGSMALKDAQCSRRRDQDAVPCLVESALRAAFQVTDEEFGDMCERAGLTGCTAVVAVVGRTHLWVANCGGCICCGPDAHTVLHHTCTTPAAHLLHTLGANTSMWPTAVGAHARDQVDVHVDCVQQG